MKGDRTREPGFRQRVGLLLGPLTFVIVWLLPLDGRLSIQAHRLAATFVWAIIYWATEAIPPPATALLASVLSILLGVAPMRSVLAPYADPVIFLFIGSFIVAEGVRESGLDRRFAFALLRSPWASRSPGHLLAVAGIITWVISLWMSNTATTAMMLPVGLGLLRALGPAGDRFHSPFPIGLLLMLTWASSVAVGIPVASPPNLIAIGLIRDLTGRHLTFFDWVAITMPISILMLLVCWLILRLRYGSIREWPSALYQHVSMAYRVLGPWKSSETIVLCVLALMIVLWMVPGALGTFLEPDHPVVRFAEARFPDALVALSGAVALFLIPSGWRAGAVLNWDHARRIDWGTVILFGGGLSLGSVMFETKLADTIGKAVVAATGAETVWALTAVAIVLGVILSEASSNTASASILVPTAIAVAAGAGVSPIPPAVGAALGASFGFMLPVSTPPNAIVYGTGLVPIGAMVSSGAVLDVIGAIVIWVGLRILCPIIGVM